MSMSYDAALIVQVLKNEPDDPVAEVIRILVPEADASLEEVQKIARGVIRTLVYEEQVKCPTCGAIGRYDTSPEELCYGQDENCPLAD